MSLLIEQYCNFRKKHEDLFIMYRVGDFYEMFFQDAIEASRLLGLTLTHRAKYRGEKVPMCGVPKCSLDGTVARLLRCNKRIGIVEELGDGPGSGILNRELVRVITPGTVHDTEFLNTHEANIIMCLRFLDDRISAVHIDVSTGRWGYDILSKNSLIGCILRLGPREIAVFTELSDIDIFLASLPFKLRQIMVLYKDLCVVQNEADEDLLHAFACKDGNMDAILLAAVLTYIYKINGTLPSLRQMPCNMHQYLKLNHATVCNLEILHTRAGCEKNSLFDFLNKTVTPFGMRRLRREVLQPFNDVNPINKRLDAIEFLINNDKKLHELLKLLSNVFDLERIVIRFMNRRASVINFQRLASSLPFVAQIGHIISEFSNDNWLISVDLIAKLDLIKEISLYLNKAIDVDANIKEDHHTLIRRGVSVALDASYEDFDKMLKAMQCLLLQYRNESKIRDLKIVYKSGFGYVIEVNSKDCNLIPIKWQIAQAGSVKTRFVTDELTNITLQKKLFDEKVEILQSEILLNIEGKISSYAKDILTAIDDIAELDIVLSFAVLAKKHSYVRPHFNNDCDLSIIGGIHPILQAECNIDFVPNDLSMSSCNTVNILFGVNMSGKSTFLRQNAIICIMAHLGSFVSCSSCSICILDQIFCRIGSGDDIYNAKSTFYTEMEEVADILLNSTVKSLCIIDEIGRGTTSHEGAMIAKAVINYLINIKAKVIVATHYHELASIGNSCDQVANISIEAPIIIDDTVHFSHKVLPEYCYQKDYAIAIASLAGMPDIWPNSV